MTFFHLSTVWKVSVFGVFLVRIFPHSEPSQISNMESFCENSQRLKRFWIRLRQAAVLPKSDYTLIILLTSSVCVDFCCHSWFMVEKCEHYQVIPKYSYNLVKKLQHWFFLNELIKQTRIWITRTLRILTYFHKVSSL